VVAIVHLAPDALADPPSMATLNSLAAEEELVLVCLELVRVESVIVGGLLPRMRQALPRRQIVALLVDGEMQPHERGLIDQLLEEGRVPLVLGLDRPHVDRLAQWSWLAPDYSVALPAHSA
jgi:hypothetical protein